MKYKYGYNTERYFKIFELQKKWVNSCDLYDIFQFLFFMVRRSLWASYMPKKNINNISQYVGYMGMGYDFMNQI